MVNAPAVETKRGFAKSLFHRARGVAERLRIRRQIKRLAPWYYRYDLKGVSTAISPPCDHHGHRTVSIPPGSEALFEGKTVLDVGCNEGGYTFAALEHGAASVDAFDCRSINIEKARFVARVLDYRNVTFQVASCDSWLRDSAHEYDFVFLCGILYHLPEPWRIIHDYCALAKEGVFVTSVLRGGEDGYSPFSEAENIAASLNPDEMSQMPNTSNTLLKEFARHGFFPTHIFEKRVEDLPDLWGGCSLVLRNCRDRANCHPGTVGGTAPQRFGIYFVPAQVTNPLGRRRPFDVDVVVCDREAAVRTVHILITVQAADGTVLHELTPEALEFVEGEVGDPFGRRSCSFRAHVDLPAAKDKAVVETTLIDPVSGRPLSSNKFVVNPSNADGV